MYRKKNEHVWCRRENKKDRVVQKWKRNGLGVAGGRCVSVAYFLVNQVFLILLLFAADQDIILAVFEKWHAAYSLSFVDHLSYFILHFYLVCLLYTLKLLMFPI